MFTGIISGVGRIAATRPLGSSLQHGQRLVIEAPEGYLADVAEGDSIAINGACMTVAAFDANASRFEIDISAESLARTAGWNEGGPVNLEKALRATDRLGGHIVAGHVDGVGVVLRFAPVGESIELRIAAPRGIARYLAYKGSIAVNGVSLTVNAVEDTATCAVCSINLIPHTVENTSLSTLAEGAKINLEVDLVARYVERMMSVGAARPATPVSPPLSERATS
ncbi:MAG: riboflavin synthase [Burkholderiales bacterium]